MKKNLFTLIFIATAIVVSAQEANDTIYNFTSERAFYKGGEVALLKQLAGHLYLPSDVDANLSGRTTIKAVVEKDGKLTNLSIVKSCSRADVDSAVLKASAFLTDFVPAENGEEIVRSYTFISASFPSFFALVPPTDTASYTTSQPVLQPEQINHDTTTFTMQHDTTTFIVVETMPEFPGGQEALFKYLSDNVKYPYVAQKNGIQGRVICQFVVNKDGAIVDVEVVRSGGDPSLDEEAVRVIKSMPKWKPGKQRDKPVRVKYTVPVNFRLRDSYTTSQPVLQSEQINHDTTTFTMQHDTTTFIVVETMPEFPGGQEALFKYLSDNVKYPYVAQKKGIQGRVICQFVVNKDGAIVDVEVVRSGGDPSLDKEAVRVIKSMPKWKPGKQRGKLVRVKYIVPVNFRLE